MSSKRTGDVADIAPDLPPVDDGCHSSSKAADVLTPMVGQRPYFQHAGFSTSGHKFASGFMWVQAFNWANWIQAYAIV